MEECTNFVTNEVQQRHERGLQSLSKEVLFSAQLISELYPALSKKAACRK
jgi:hypothetical protein